MAVAGVGGASSDDDALFVPADLPNTEMSGDGGLTLIAFTLQDGDGGPELYAAVRNDGEAPACEAGMTTYFVDASDQLVHTVTTPLHGGRPYRIDDGSDVVIACIPPGEVAMAATTALPSAVDIAALGYLEHAFPSFTVSPLVALGSLSVAEVQAKASAGGTAFTGTFTNQLEVSVSNPSVSIFPLNRVGRPLGVATASASTDVAPGDSWSFETNAVSQAGSDHAAYGAATVSPE